jgi:hypothetical protein
MNGVRIIHPLFTILLVTLLVGCSNPTTTPTQFPASATPVPTQVPPTNTAKSTPKLVDPIQVTFTGIDCEVQSPNELPPGDYTFRFMDLSELSGELYLVNLNIGKTTQDLLDGQSEPGDWYPKPAWAHYDRQVAIETEQLEDRRVDISTWSLERVGEHTILCYVASPQMLWMPGFINIVEPPSG